MSHSRGARRCGINSVSDKLDGGAAPTELGRVPEQQTEGE